MKPLSIFISHPSEFLTNCQPHGDGLAAFEFVNRLAQRGHIVHVAAPAMEIQGDLPSNLKIYPVSTRIPFSRLQPLEYMLRVRQLFNQVSSQSGVDVIHQLNPVHAGLSFPLISSQVPLVLGLFVPSWPADVEMPQPETSFAKKVVAMGVTSLLKFCDRQQQNSAAALLLSTPAALSCLHTPAVNQAKAHILPYGIDPTDFSLSGEGTAQLASQPTILYLASVSRRKGIFTLLEAFQQVVKAVPSCQVVIAGSGTELAAVEQQVAAMPCQAQISLLGKVERKYVPGLMQACTVYCLPSYGEPFGISALEAMACGKPVVATNTGGLAYLVPELGGRQVPPGSPIDLANALIEILTSSELQIQMGQYNRSWVEENFNWERIIEKLEAIYYQLLKDKNAQSSASHITFASP